MGRYPVVVDVVTHEYMHALLYQMFDKKTANR